MGFCQNHATCDSGVFCVFHLLQEPGHLQGGLRYNDSVYLNVESLAGVHVEKYTGIIPALVRLPVSRTRQHVLEFYLINS